MNSEVGGRGDNPPEDGRLRRLWRELGRFT